jgi:hypothetical protein
MKTLMGLKHGPWNFDFCLMLKRIISKERKKKGGEGYQMFPYHRKSTPRLFTGSQIGAFVLLVRETSKRRQVWGIGRIILEKGKTEVLGGQPVTKTCQLMMYREMIAVCSQIHTKHINTLCGQT